MKHIEKVASDSAASKKSPHAEREEKILEFWKKNRIFEKTNEGRDDAPEFTFYDGPPFATGTPHFGHLLPTSLKDAIPRYQVMKGNRVRRVWGWDCHGLPLENLIEKELGLKTKKDIEDLGIGKFNAAARASVLRYENEWKKIIPRVGRFVDMEHPYKTMDASYTETIWWMFHELSKKELVYQGFKAMHLCPRCETTLSNFEVNQGYKDTTDISVFVKFKMVGEENTFFLAWTTTPWTLPGNAALAVNPTVEYVKFTVVKITKDHPKFIFKEQETYLVGKDWFEKEISNAYFHNSKLDKGGVHHFESSHVDLVIDLDKISLLKGTDLVKLSYEPVFPYYKDAKLEHKENAWKVYGADFVTTTDGTGIVHIAPAFGSDDYALSRKESIPFIQHVGVDGKFKKEVTDFAGQSVKPKSDDEKVRLGTDILIIKYLQDHGTFFAKEKVKHSYPHCWRCDTPLLNYATSSWFVKVSAIKEKMLEENRKVKWVPESIGQYRFGNWIEGSPDWAISRSRYWGAPLPVWMSEDGEERDVFGSIEDLAEKTKSTNNYFLVRHGEADQNLSGTVSCVPTDSHHLTEKGKEQVGQSAAKLSGKKIDMIFTSDFVRTKETAEIVRQALGLSKEQVIEDVRLRENNVGVYNGKPWATLHADFAGRDRFVEKPEGGETFMDVRARMYSFLKEIDIKYIGKNILVISHDTPLFFFVANVHGWTKAQCLAQKDTESNFFKTGDVHEISYSALPLNENFELDFHRPFIDEIEYVSNGKKMRRVPEVFDCWFESGAMPYAQWHYPFENKDKCDPEKGIGFPADFIAEGLDQTRGWFYSLLVLGVALFGKSPYKSVIVNGLILAEDGQKMSKSKKNYKEILPTIDEYGVDAIRYYLLASPSVHADDFCFSEKGVDEVVKKHVNRLENVFSFFEMYKERLTDKKVKSDHVLDEWILARLDEVILKMSNHLDAHELDKATTYIGDFVDDLSTWYIRRSRDRFKSEDKKDANAALATTHTVLLTLSKVIAPFMPFFAEDLYLKLGGGKESIHLENWPKVSEETNTAKNCLGAMIHARKIVSLALEARTKANIKVRQPLALLTIKEGIEAKNAKEYYEVICDEVNVKEVRVDANQKEEVVLDTTITPALKMEGDFRDLVRKIQEARKEANLTVSDRVSLSLTANKNWKTVIEKFHMEIISLCGLTKISLETGESPEPLIRLEK